MKNRVIAARLEMFVLTDAQNPFAVFEQKTENSIFLKAQNIFSMQNLFAFFEALIKFDELF